MEQWNRGWGERGRLQHYFNNGFSLCERFLQQKKAVDVMDVEHGGYICAKGDPSFCQECVERWKDLRISEGDRMPGETRRRKCRHGKYPFCVWDARQCTPSSPGACAPDPRVERLVLSGGRS